MRTPLTVTALTLLVGVALAAVPCPASATQACDPSRQTCQVPAKSEALPDGCRVLAATCSAAAASTASDPCGVLMSCSGPRDFSHGAISDPCGVLMSCSGPRDFSHGAISDPCGVLMSCLAIDGLARGVLPLRHGSELPGRHETSHRGLLVSDLRPLSVPLVLADRRVVAFITVSGDLVWNVAETQAALSEHSRECDTRRNSLMADLGECAAGLAIGGASIATGNWLLGFAGASITTFGCARTISVAFDFGHDGCSVHGVSNPTLEIHVGTIHFDPGSK